MKKKQAFTLAEVLITLGIIGVVAAMTLPVLIKEYQKVVWVNQLKKSVSIWEQGMQKMMADDGVTRLSDTEFWQGSDDIYSCGDADYPKLNNILKRHFNVLKFYQSGQGHMCSLGEYNEYKTLDKTEVWSGPFDDCRIIWMADGTNYGLFARECSEHDCGILYIDVNGTDKKPNIWGRDTFAFDITNNGNLIPMHKDDWENLNACGNSKNSNNLNGSLGVGCAARIMENGWKMDY